MIYTSLYFFGNLWELNVKISETVSMTTPSLFIMILLTSMTPCSSKFVAISIVEQLIGL